MKRGKVRGAIRGRGFTQTPCIDFHDTYSPTAKLSALRTVLACGVELGMHFNQMDIKTAYLNAPIQEDIYMEQPEGYQNGKQMVCKLKRSLYRLKQSGRNWFECLSSHLFELNFKASVHDPCLLTVKRSGHKCWIVICVDDILHGSTDNEFTTWFNDKMSELSNIGESGPLRWFLGISYKCGDSSLTMKHQGYVSNLLRKHGMSECKAASTPLADKLELTKDQMPEDGSDEQQQMLRHDYRGLLGSIAYFSMSTRSDLAFLAHILSRSRFLRNPGFVHWQAAKHVLRYLRGTADVGITFMKCDDTGLIGYTDSDYAS